MLIQEELRNKMITRKELLEKIDPLFSNGWFKSIDCGDGWLQIIDDLINGLNKLNIKYSIQQIKEKFGTLRFYFSIIESTSKNDNDTADFLVDLACILSSKTCEICGEIGTSDSTKGWTSIVCETCKKKNFKEIHLDD